MRIPELQFKIFWELLGSFQGLPANLLGSPDGALGFLEHSRQLLTASGSTEAIGIMSPNGTRNDEHVACTFSPRSGTSNHSTLSFEEGLEFGKGTATMRSSSKKLVW